MDEKKKAVIIGGGIAGVQAAGAINGMSVHLISDEPYLPYYRMRIEEIFSGNTPESLYMHPQSWYEEKGIALIKGHVSSIDRESKIVKLSDGREICYDKLLLATGSHARRVELPGTIERSFVLRSMSDAVRMRKELENADSFAVLGGGLLGLEAAYSVASDFHIPVTVLETAPYILPRQLDKESAEILSAKLLESGVTVITSASVRECCGDYLVLADGRKIPASVFCFSIGVDPAKELAEGAHLTVNRGIVVGENLASSDPDIFACGDSAELNGRTFGLALHAREMGSAAAKAMMGECVSYKPSEPTALLKVGGIDVVSFGTPEGEKKVETDGEKRRTFFIKDGIIVGAVLLNDKASMMSVKAMIGKKA